MIILTMAAFHFAAAIIGGVSAASSPCTVNDGFASTLLRDEDVDLMGAVSLLQIRTSDPSQQQVGRSAWQHSGNDQQMHVMPQQFQATAETQQSLFSQLHQVENAAMANQRQWRRQQQQQHQQQLSQLLQLQQPPLGSQEEQWQQLQPQLAALPELPTDPFPWVTYSAPPPQALSTSQTHDAQNQLQQVTLSQFQAHASTQPQLVQLAPWMGPKPTTPVSGLRSSLEAAATSKMERAFALAQSSLAQVGLMQDRLSLTAKQLGETAQSQQVSHSLQQAFAEKASRQAHSSQAEQLVQALLVEAAQLQQQLNALNEHLAYVATLNDGQAQSADSALALGIAEERAAMSEAAARSQSALAQAEQRLQVDARASEESAANARAEAYRASVAEAREDKAETLLREAQTRERVAEQHEFQVESQAGQEINNLRGMLEQAQVQLQESEAELQRTRAAALQAGESADVMQEEAVHATVAQMAQVQAQVAGDVQSAKSSVAEVGQLIQGLVNSSSPVAVA